MNPYILGGGALVLAIMGFLLKGAYERTGELEAKLETQVEETIEAVQANQSCLTTIDTQSVRITEMIEERRVDTERREQVLVEREQELLRANARAADLEEERDNEISTNANCAELTALDVSFFCPATGGQLRERSRGPGGNGDTDG
jgi:SMC interacting uncharacterized protein involved in chromosome segregation